MYEGKTVDLVKKSILDRITSEIDKREGSFVNDMISPTALAIYEVYEEFDNILDIMFLDKAYDEYVDMKVGELGVTRKPGIKSTVNVLFEGTEGTTVPKGTIVCTDTGLEFITLIDGEISNGGVEIIVEAAAIGKEYNVLPKTITTVLTTGISGINAVTNNDSAAGGVDRETDSELITRYYMIVRNPASSGNIHHYKQWALEVNGVGEAIVLPLWNGAGTVKVIIADGNKAPASPTLISEVSEHIEEVRPVGASVTVSSVTSKPITISAKVTLAAGFTLSNVQTTFVQSIQSYLKKISMIQTYVSYATIGSILLDTPGIIDYTELTLNGNGSNIALSTTEVPLLDNVTLT